MAQKKPNEGPPKSSRLPSGCPSPTATSAPHSPGGRRTESAIGSQATTSSAPLRLARRASASMSSTAPRKLGCCRKTAAVSLVDRVGERGGVGHPAVEADLDHLGAEAGRVGGERLAAVGMQAARDDQLRATGRADRQVGGRGDRRGPFVERGVRDRQAGQLRHRGLELEHRLQPALGDLGLVGRVGRQELRAADDRVDDRGHVVVVHPGAEEADLRVGVGVARRQPARRVVDLAARACPRAARAGGPGGAPRGCRRTARRSRRRRSRRASPRGQRRWPRCSGSPASPPRPASP